VLIVIFLKGIYRNPGQVRDHLIRHEFNVGYIIWTWHRESRQTAYDSAYGGTSRYKRKEVDVDLDSSRKGLPAKVHGVVLTNNPQINSKDIIEIKEIQKTYASMLLNGKMMKIEARR
jgi:hypothetical protein